ncbi:glycosyltransferase 87 family protein [Streptomyces sp. B-S-A8]|uniref:Glycosyltransferase 87 family protein n=1 Tax=Streptomyces solicavernae TaxID=3043614 RepID=A0ABT6RUR1_9ACTN|nr:glycosyltransferase 87 family protein [Streptomyces sp. B-S-A8]MDI3388175.1 glycosyltransferase 87 family protein [Streptomyces sp. B-S-A8]
MIHRTVTSRSPRVIASGVLLLVSLAAFAALCVTLRIPMADTLVYRAEGAAVVGGTDLYGFTVTEWNLPATYPPFAAILFVPTTWLPIPLLKIAFVAGNVALLALLVHLSFRFTGLSGSRARPWLPLAATGLALWLEPVFQTLLFGQINLALVCLVLWDLSRPEGAVGKGFALGIAAGIKLTPGFFVVYLLLVGRIRTAATATASFVGTVLLGVLVLPGASVEFWTRRMFETGRVGKVWIVDNQSLQGLLARVLRIEEPGLLWAVPALLVAALGLWLARRAHHHGHSQWGLLTAAFTALLISPISWSHHWVWCVPLAALLLAERRVYLAVVVTALFTARTHWLLPHDGELDLQYPWWQQPLASPYPLLGLALLGCVAVWTGRRRVTVPTQRANPARPADRGDPNSARPANQGDPLPARPAFEDEPAGRSSEPRPTAHKRAT